MERNLVRDVRHYKNMTQTQFAKWLGVAESTIAQVEAGYRKVSLTLASKIALKFDASDPDFIAYQKRKHNASHYFFNK